MNKIPLIIHREYFTRVRKKSFIVMTILGPILMAAMIIIPVWIATREDDNIKVIAVIDNPINKFQESLEDSKSIKYEYVNETDLKDLYRYFTDLNFYAVLYNPDKDNYSADSITLLSNKQPSITVKQSIAGAMERKIEKEKLKKIGIDENLLNSIKTNVNIRTIKWSAGGKEEKSSTELVMALGYVLSIVIYMFIFIYGAQVMRGVIEEKTNRIVEIIISSVKPFELMMGKIIGVALVALTQFVLYIVLTFVIVTVTEAVVLNKPSNPKFTISETVKEKTQMNMTQNEKQENNPFNEVFSSFKSISWGLILFSFIFYFLFGYLLYASLFAAIGSAVDNETETQQFMLPVTIPLILSIILAQTIIINPDGPLAFWFSIIPLTSPIIMLIRIPFGVKEWEIILSMVILVASFVGTTWMAGKIYRTGILLYGKKVNYKELWKWLRYKN